MTRWDRDLTLGFRGWTLVAGLSALVLLAWAIFLGTRARSEPVRCGSGFQALGPRCCAPGQGLSAGQCIGVPARCPHPFLLVKAPIPGCVYPATPIPIAGGSVTLGPTDWDSVNVVEKRKVVVTSFSMDTIEVTYHRYQKCVDAGMCKPLATEAEPGRPLTGLSAAAAAEFCAFDGGRLPTPAEWIFAASGEEARRFPWGPHGLVCRRAAFGLVHGPCANEGIFPEIAGQRRDGGTPQGLLDLSGNVAEWALDEKGHATLHGGSFRNQTASGLKVWSTRPSEAADDVGFRCVYDPGNGP